MKKRTSERQRVVGAKYSKAAGALDECAEQVSAILHTAASW